MQLLFRLYLFSFAVLFTAVPSLLRSQINYSDSVKVYLFNDNDKAIKWAKAYYYHAEQSNDLFAKATASNLYGHTFYNQAIYDSALHYYFQSLNYCKKGRNEKYLPVVYNSIASAYYWQGLNEEALFHYQKALEQFTQQQDTFWMVNVRYNLANIHSSAGRFSKAKKEYKTALLEYYELKDTLSASYALLGLGKIAIEEDSLKTALQYLNKALSYSKPDYDLYTYSLLHTRLGQIYLELKDEKKAYYFLQNGAETAKNSGDTRQLSEALYELRKYFNVTKDITKYASITQTYDSLTEIIYAEKQAEAVAKMKAEYQLNELNQQLRKEQMETKRVKQRNIILAIAIFASLIVIITISRLFLKTKKQNNIIDHQKNELEHLIKEKDILLKEIHHRVKNNLQIVSSLLSLQHAFRQKENSADNELKNAFLRINSMALLHKEIYNSNQISKTSIHDYILELIDQILSNFSNDLNVHTHLNIDKSIYLEIEKAVPLGLIFNELLTNSIKHKFIKVQTGNIYFSIIQEENTIIMKYSDRDNGAPFTKSTSTFQPGFGTKLIDIFCKKLKAEYQYTYMKDGAYFFMQFKTPDNETT